MKFDQHDSFFREPLHSGGTPPAPIPEADIPASEISRAARKSTDSRRPWVTDDLRVPWSWIDLLVFALVAVIGALVVNVILIIVFSAFGVTMTSLRDSPHEMGFLAVFSQAILFLALLSYLAVQIRIRAGTPFWHTIGWRPLESLHAPRALSFLGFIAGGLFLSFIVQLTSSAFPPKTKLPMQALFQDRRTAVLIMLMSVLLAPIVEETIFRGYIYPVIARTFGVAASAIATGTLFGLLHAPQLWGGWVQIASLVVVGIVFTYARAFTRTVVASYLLHVSYNSFILIAFLIASHGLRIMPPDY